MITMFSSEVNPLPLLETKQLAQNGATYYVKSNITRDLISFSSPRIGILEQSDRDAWSAPARSSAQHTPAIPYRKDNLSTSNLLFCLVQYNIIVLIPFYQ